MDDRGAQPGADGAAGRNDPEPEGDTGLDLILDEVDTVVDPIAESMAFGPAPGIAAAGGPMVTLPPDTQAPGRAAGDDSMKAGLLEAGPVAVAGMAVNVAAALVVIAVARLLPSQAYGELAQLLGLFFILSMPGSAVLVGVVRRVTGLQTTGQSHLVRRWVARVHRLCLVALGVELVVVLALQGWIARQLHLPNGEGVVLILMAAGVWILLCVDRGLLQAHRSYRGLAGNLLVEGGVRTVLVVVLVVAGAGVPGYALGVLSARWWPPPTPTGWPAGRGPIRPRPPWSRTAPAPSGRPHPPPSWPAASSWPTCPPRSWDLRSSASSRTST